MCRFRRHHHELRILRVLFESKLGEAAEDAREEAFRVFLAITKMTTKSSAKRISRALPFLDDACIQPLADHTDEHSITYALACAESC